MSKILNKKRDTKIRSAVILISGGLDSAVIAAIANKEKFETYFLFADYGQKTLKKEKECVKKLANFFSPKKVLFLDLTWLRGMGKSGLFDKNVKLTENNLPLQYVPFRNSILLSTATAWAETLGAEAIFIGSSGSDRTCPDNTPEYLKAFQKVVDEGTLLKKGIVIKAPLVKREKEFAIKLGIKLDVPFGFTWSCHNNNNHACGQCGNCTARIEAFSAAGEIDPIKYAPKLNED